MTLEQLRQDYRKRLFEQFLPFWEKGGLDEEHGGIMCELSDDGSVAVDLKYIWYQGRAVWVYAYLYNRFGKDPKWLKTATTIRDFMVKSMYIGRGRWNEEVRRDGSVIKGEGKDIYGALFAAAGLVQYYAATGREEDLQLALESIRAAVRRYDDPEYQKGGENHTLIEIDPQGLRQNGHSMMFVWTLAQLLEIHADAEMERLQAEHVDALLNRFWNPAYGIQNEMLAHDYSRLPQTEAFMYAGHALESLWMVMHEALRSKNRKLFDTAKDRARRLIEMCWDYVFDGWADEDFSVFGTKDIERGPRFEVKTMWSHCEILIACLTVMEYTGEDWARLWYDRAHDYLTKHMADTPHGVWRQAVDRGGKDVKRKGISIYRKCNFHQPRMLMMNLESLDRTIANRGGLTPFPQ